MTGAGTELGRIGTALRTIEPERTRSSGRSTAGAVHRGVGLAAAAAVVIIYGVTRGNWLEGLLAGIATAMAMLLEEFPVVLTVFLALGAWRCPARPDAAVTGHRSTRVGDGHLCRQNRHADDDQHERA